mgnify:CR=1 FL=1
MAAAVQRHPRWGLGRDWLGIAKECRRVLLRELDFRLEAKNQDQFNSIMANDKTSRPVQAAYTVDAPQA